MSESSLLITVQPAVHNVVENFYLLWYQKKHYAREVLESEKFKNKFSCRRKPGTLSGIRPKFFRQTFRRNDWPKPSGKIKFYKRPVRIRTESLNFWLASSVYVSFLYSI